MTWATFLKLLGAENIVWVPTAILKAAGVVELELPLFRPERGARSGLMDVSNERARAAGLGLTRPEDTLQAVRADLVGRKLTPMFSPEREAELIQIAGRKPG